MKNISSSVFFGYVTHHPIFHTHLPFIFHHLQKAGAHVENFLKCHHKRQKTWIIPYLALVMRETGFYESEGEESRICVQLD